MMDWRLRRRLQKARARWRHLRWVWTVTVLWCVAIVASGAVWWGLTYSSLRVPNAAEWMIGAIVLTLAVITWRMGRLDRDLTAVAKRIETRFPELQSSLLAAIEIQPDFHTGRVSYLQDRVIGQVLAHAYQSPWERIVGWRALCGAHIVHWLLFSLLLVALWQVELATRRRPPVALAAEVDAVAASSARFEVRIEPGDTEVERGTSLLVLARFTGELPPEATLIARVPGQDEARVPMAKALEDPLFGGSVPNVKEPLEYFVEYAGRRSPPFQVAVFEFPRLVRADAQLKFPAYTSLEDKAVQDVRRLAAVVGTEVTLTLELNKPVATAKLVASPDESFELRNVPDRPRHYETTVRLEKSLRLELQLLDDQARKNKESAEFILTAIANQPPDLKLAVPGKDTQVSPLEELALRAKAFDDFGLKRVGLTWTLAGQQEKELVLAKEVKGKERWELEHLVEFEALAAEPDQLLSYYLWAEDMGPDGELRRTESDLYFAEVRPFEEIFRQGDQPPGGESEQQQPPSNQNANEAEQLAELQKEIINATWKILRRENADQVSAAFDSDVSLLIESQTKALAQAEKLAEQVRDAQSMRHVDEVRRHMNEAIKRLLESKEQKSEASLRPALDAEQSAHQSLLRLRAREHNVVRRQSSSRSAASASRSSSRSQQQLEQLELKDKQNRYEAERTAQTPEDPVEREMRQVLNRLKELARRQEDLNERLKEMLSALQEAQTPEQKEELDRQLKRLQEEQEQMLRDTEELQNRIDEPQNAERMADARQQLDDARERVRQSAESLREGQVSQATAAGARAQEDFEQLRDEFRKQTSSRFQEEVRELSEEAKQLDDKQQQLAQDLKNLEQPQEGPKTLRDVGGREQLVEGLGEQRERAERLMDRMRQTIQDAEGPQPLLAEQLYDTVRQVQQKNLDQNLETTREALRRGLMEPARQQEESARGTIRELRAGVERAAQSVLGDEEEALRRAQEQLDTLANQLNQELAQNGQAPVGESRRDSPDQASQPSDPNSPPTAPGKASPAGESRRDSPNQASQPGDPLSQLTGGGNRQFAPFSGGDFREWSDRLRDVEEMLGDPQLSADAARIRERARALRADSRRHSVPPNWDLVKMEVAEPLAELLDRVRTEVLKRAKTDELVPLDRDPVPAEFKEQVRKYYERLGTGQ